MFQRPGNNRSKNNRHRCYRINGSYLFQHFISITSQRTPPAPYPQGTQQDEEPTALNESWMATRRNIRKDVGGSRNTQSADP